MGEVVEGKAEIVAKDKLRIKLIGKVGHEQFDGVVGGRGPIALL